MADEVLTSPIAMGAVARRLGRVPRTYYPTALLRLTVRLEDHSNDDGPRAVSEGAPPAQRAAEEARDAEAARLEADVRRALGDDVTEEAGQAAAQAAAARAAPSGTEHAPPNDVPPDPLTFTVCVVPLDMRPELNGFRIADKLQASFALSDLPISPEIVRSVLVEAYQGTAAAEDFGDVSRWAPALLATQAPIFRGYVDTMDMEAGDDFRVCLQARSLEAVLMDREVNPRAAERRVRTTDSYRDPGTGRVVRGERVSAYVRRFLGTLPEFSGARGDAMGVRLFPNVDPDQEPILSRDMFLRSLQTAASRAAAGGAVQAAPPGDPSAQSGTGAPVVPGSPTGKMSAWDVIVRAAQLCGLIPIYDPSLVLRDDRTGAVVRGADTLLLVTPQTVKETPSQGLTIEGGAPDGFEREFSMGGVGAPLRSEVRFLVWGRNLKRQKFSRKFGRVKAPAVLVRSYDPDGKIGGRVLSAQFPKTPRGVTASAAGTGQGGTATGRAPTNDLFVVDVRGVRSQAVLEQIAVAAYHGISRQEVSVEIETDEMSSYEDPTRGESNNENPDLLRLRPGTPCRVLVASRVDDPANGDTAVDTLSRLMQRRFDADFLRRALVGGSAGPALSARGRENVERTIAKIEDAYRRSRLTDWFYVRTVTHSWSADNGYSCTMELANFIEARNLPANLSAEDKATNDRVKRRVPGKTKKTPEEAAADEARGEAEVAAALGGR